MSFGSRCSLMVVGVNIVISFFFSSAQIKIVANVLYERDRGKKEDINQVKLLLR